jgi:hypothetical protein
MFHCDVTNIIWDIKGCLSFLMREAYANSAKSAGPGGSIPPFILESSSPKSRDRYKHLGFEVSLPVYLLISGCNLGRIMLPRFFLFDPGA